MAAVSLQSPTPLALTGGVEAFVPCDFSAGVRRIGGLPVVLMLVDSATSTEALTMALGLLVSIVRFNSLNTRQMEDLHGYEVLGYVDTATRIDLCASTIHLMGPFVDFIV